MTLLVTGGRSYTNRNLVWRVLDLILFDVLVHGACPTGADRWADLWARDRRRVKVKAYPAQWDTYGRGAGMLRNKLMLETEHPDFVVAFPGGPGTENMKALARQAGVTVLEIT